MTEFRLYILGTPLIEIDGDELKLPRRKGLAMLVYLAVTGEAQRRDTLATLFWPESGQSRARGNLRRELFSLRNALQGDWLMMDGEHVTLNWNANIWVDALKYRESLHNKEHETALTLERVQAAVELYRDDFLTGFSLNDCPDFDDWQFFEADGFRQELLNSLDKLIENHRQQGSAENAISYAQRRLAMDVLDESAHRTLMELYALAGQQSAAFRQYKECIRIFEEEFGAPPEEATTALYESIRTRRHQKPTDNQAPTTSSVISHTDSRLSARQSPPPVNNLPTQLASFIGRKTELLELEALLKRPDVRLVTIVAPGGMGKTRLSIEVARRLTDTYADGVWFLSLVGVNDRPQFLSALIQLFNVPMGESDALEAILRFLSTRRLLLVLDNFEQLVDEAEILAGIVHSAPYIDLLVTSRLRLNLLEEWSVPLEGLETEGDEIKNNDAIQLFAERASQVQPDFDLSANVADVLVICRLVGRMPLGIELAATWLRAMSCAEIASEIAEDLDFLSTPLRNVPAQHRSIRTVFEHSWALLTPREQSSLARLWVFQGGFTRQAASVVTKTGLALLSSLVDHSLLRRSKTGRYDIHELLRQFAGEKLEESEDADTIHRAHADYFLAYLTGRAEDLQWRRPIEALTELTPERENLFAAWQRAAQRRMFQQIRAGAPGLLQYCNWTNTQESGRQLFEQAIDAVETESGNMDNWSSLLGSLKWRQGALEPPRNRSGLFFERMFQSRQLLVQSESDSQKEIAMLDVFLSLEWGTVGSMEEAVSTVQGTIQTFTETKNLMRLGWAYYGLGLLYSGEGKLLLADQAYDQADATWQQAGAPPYPLLWRCIVYQMQGEYIEQRRTLERAKELSDDPFSCETEPNLGRGAIENSLGEAAVALGELDQATALFEKAHEIFEAEDQQWMMSGGLRYSLGTILRLKQQMLEARRQIVWEVDAIQAIDFGQRIAARLHELARLEYDEGNYAQSEAALEEALEISHSIGFTFIEALVLCQMGHTAAAQSRPEAIDFYRQALVAAQEQGMNGIALDVLLGMGTLSMADEKWVTSKGRESIGLLALAASHPNSEWETKMRAQRALEPLEKELPADMFHAASENGREANLTEVISGLLERFPSEQK